MSNWSSEQQHEDEDDDYNFDQEYPENYQNQDLEEPAAPVVDPPVGRQGLGSRMGTARMGPSGPEPTARPMTSISSVNYNAQQATGQAPARNSVNLHAKKLETTPELQARDLEKKVNFLMEESSTAAVAGELRLALEKAKEALKKERALAKFREQNGIAEGLNLDLTYSCYFNLANCYHKNGQYSDAMATYNLIVKNKQYAQGGRMRVNMGNICFEQKKYKEAIKMYRMAMDQIPNTAKEMRFRIMRNIGVAWIAMGKFSEAIQSFETVMEASPDYRSALNLILCYYVTGNVEKMKSAYSAMLAIRKTHQHADEAKDSDDEGDTEEQEQDLAPNDALRQTIRERQRFANRYIILASKLIAPAIEKDFATGFDYIVETLRATKNNDLANELEISKALTFMNKKDVHKAIDTLKEFEKKDNSMATAAATNLSFLYYLEKDLKNAEKYSNAALKADRFNARAYVNKGNIFFSKGKLDEAREMYQEALLAESDCVEALYNLGLVIKKQGAFEKALQYFNKLQQIIPNHSEVVFQIASLHEEMGNLKEAEDKYKKLLTLVPTDPNVFQRLGHIYAKQEDDIMAHQAYMESYRFFPGDLAVVSWLGAYYVKGEVYEKALKYFKRAAQLEPSESKWQLMIASCYRRMRAFRQAKNIYEDIYRKDPNNVECLRYLVQICNELGLKDQVDEYVTSLRKAEQANFNNNENNEQDTADHLISEQNRLDRSSFSMNHQFDYNNVGYANFEPPWAADGRQERPGTRARARAQEEDFGEDEFAADELLPL